MVAVPDNVFSNLVFVETKNSPFTVSGARTRLKICSPSLVPSEEILSTVAEAYPYSDVSL